MKYHNIPFYIASESIKKSEEIGSFLSRQNNTQFRSIDIPEIYSYLKKFNNFTCFIIELTNQIETIDNILKTISQKNPNFPIILISSQDISLIKYRHFIRLGASDVLVINDDSNKKEILDEVILVLNLKWRSYLYTLKENEKVFQASVVTANHEINQPLTVMLNAIGLLKAELRDQAGADSKVNSHLNFLTKGTMRIQSILETLKKVKKLSLKEYTPGVWMINLNSDQPQEMKINRVKINNKNTVLVVNKNLEDKTVIENELKKMGLEIVNTSDLKEAEIVIDKMNNRIQAVLFSTNISSKELESTLFKLNNRAETIPLILIRNADTSPENLKLMDSTIFQILNKPVNSKALHEAIVNSVIVAN
jgi:hypothetical protein